MSIQDVYVCIVCTDLVRHWSTRLLERIISHDFIEYSDQSSLGKQSVILTDQYLCNK